MKKAIQSLEEVRKTSTDFSINAEMFTPDIVELRKKLRSNGYKPLAEFAKYIKRGSQPEYSTDGTIKALRSVNIRENGFSNDRQEFVTEDFYNKNPRMHIFKGDVLLNSTGVGTLGRCCFVFNNEKFVIDGHITRISKLEELSPEFLYVYLNSKYGQLQINKLYKGSSGQIEIYPEQIQLIYIKPLKMQKLISNLVQLSYQYREKCIQYYKEANSYLKKELTLNSEHLSHKLWFVKNYSDVKDANRFDAEYFQPKYDELIKSIKNYFNGYDKLKHMVKIKDINFVPKSKEEYKYIELANIAKSGEINDCTVDFGKNLPTRARRIVSTCDVVVSSIEGSLDSVALITSDNNNALCSTGFYVINSNSINSETLFCLMKSEFIQMQLKRGCSGTILTAINKDEFENIILPKINNNVQIQIKENIQEMYKLRCQSKQFLEIAKRGVEIAIEQDEDIATRWINQELQKIGVEL